MFEKYFAFRLVLTLLLVMSFCAASVAAEDRVQQVQNLSVVDGRGKRVGNVLGFYVTNGGGEWGGAATIALRVEGNVVVLYVRPGGFTGFEGGFTRLGGGFYYESASCTGRPFMNPLAVNPPLVPPHILAGTKLFVFDGLPRPIIVGSLEEGPNNTCRPITPEETVAQPLRFLIGLADHIYATVHAAVKRAVTDEAWRVTSDAAFGRSLGVFRGVPPASNSSLSRCTAMLYFPQCSRRSSWRSNTGCG